MSPTRRRPRGEGSIWRDDARGLWVGRLPLPPGPRGERRRTAPVYGASEREVRAKLDALRGGPADRTRQTLAQYLDWYIDSHLAGRNLDPSTVASRRRNLTAHVAEHIGGVRLADLAPEHLDDLQAAWRDLSPGTRRLVWSQLRQALTVAERYRRVPRNWCDVVPGPRGPTSSKGLWLEPADALALLDATAEDRLAAWYRVSLGLGLRVGEGLGLEWDRVDVDAGRLTVGPQLQPMPGGWTLKPLKGREWGVTREVRLPAFAVESLRRHRREQLAERLRGAWSDPIVDTPDGPRPADLVFRRPDGGPLRGNAMGRHVRSACERAGLALRTPHDMRRSAASFLAAQGVELPVTMEILGWSSAQVALRVYQRATEQGLTEAAAALDDLLGGQPN